MVEHYFSPIFPQLKIGRDEFLGLGRQNPNDHNEPFGMTVLALRLANVANGVSALHGIVSRKMWKNIWPELPDSEAPITSITNGIHTHSWVSPDMTQLFDRYIGVEWDGRPDEPNVWKRVDGIPDAELWRTHERRRERLVGFARARLRQQLKNRGAPPAEIARAEEVLDPEALTIGFARRFATYKRGALLFRNLERLTAIINDKDRPVQVLFAGKAHPKDHGGKELIAEILQFARRPEFRRRVVFIEDYDINVARYLLQGVDVWLNNPRRPLEASGTSGMKAACNGGLNLSILDGWWCEGYDGQNGFAIGAGEEYTDLTYQDDVESRAMYDLLEQEIIPLFYTRSSDGLPRGWLRMMKHSITTLAPVFNTGRMVAEYTTRCYLPSAQALPAADGRQPQARGGAGGVAARPGARLVAGEGGGRRRQRGRPDARRHGPEGQRARGPRRLPAGGRGGAVVPRPGRFAGRDPAAGDGADVAQRRPRRLDVGVQRGHPVQLQRPARLRGARAAAQRRPGQPVRAGAGDVGLSGVEQGAVSRDAQRSDRTERSAAQSRLTAPFYPPQRPESHQRIPRHPLLIGPIGVSQVEDEPPVLQPAADRDVHRQQSHHQRPVERGRRSQPDLPQESQINRMSQPAIGAVPHEGPARRRRRGTTPKTASSPSASRSRSGPGYRAARPSSGSRRRTRPTAPSLPVATRQSASAASPKSVAADSGRSSDRTGSRAAPTAAGVPAGRAPAAPATGCAGRRIAVQAGCQ